MHTPITLVERRGLPKAAPTNNYSTKIVRGGPVMKFLTRCFYPAVAVAALSLSLSGTAFGQAPPAAAPPAAAPPAAQTGQPDYKAVDPTGLPIIGTWRINLDKSSPRLRAMRDPSWTSEYAVVNGGIHTVWETYPPKSWDLPWKGVGNESHTYWFKLDGKQIYKDPQGPNGQNQTVSMWLADRYTVFRQRTTAGVEDERVLMQVSPDGKTLTWMNWSANMPNPEAGSMIIVFDRVKDDSPRLLKKD